MIVLWPCGPPPFFFLLHFNFSCPYEGIVFFNLPFNRVLTYSHLQLEMDCSCLDSVDWFLYDGYTIDDCCKSYVLYFY
jgi:hypothetical protein